MEFFKNMQNVIILFRNAYIVGKTIKKSKEIVIVNARTLLPLGKREGAVHWMG